ncbi:replication-relaxation family protein [Phytohabitans kaempferiae]|uniref:Replication-relaxation family protein n=1 Tax=Phytohabitans kaempferiae TaxID=1620943 RepID=A0ABV6MF28_9ACTN
MPDRSYLTRLRASGGPSHELLVLLHQHRVMTTDQLARATGTPERTVRYRLDQLHDARLVECVRPGREAGSAPRHWWLRPAGARLVSGTAAADGRPSGMFVAHAAAITEVWLAMKEQVEVTGWLTDRAGWQEWERAGLWSSSRFRLTPDAVARVTLHDAANVVAFIEVDLATMTQTLLKQKLARYLAYVEDRAWEGVYPHCPPLLLLTTTATRAATFARTATQVIGEPFAPDDPAAGLVVAACGLVRQPARAVIEPCWMLPEAAAAELTLAEIFAERVDALDASERWHRHQETVVRRRADIEALRDVQSFTALADWLGSGLAAEALKTLIGTEPSEFLDSDPDLALRAVDWAEQRRRVDRFTARERARPLVSTLESLHTGVLRDQARRLLAAEEHLAEGDPRVYRLATTLAGGKLASKEEIALLNLPPARRREELQRELFGEYLIRRTAVVDRKWSGFSRRDRRRITREQLAAAYDDDHLLVCETCELMYPQDEPDVPYVAWCRYCDGALLDWPDRDRVVPVSQRVASIRSFLD